MRKLFTILIALHLMLIPMPARAAGITGQLTGIAIASVGVSLAAACGLKSPSLLLYIAGAAVYLMGEMNGGKAQKDQLEATDKSMEELRASGVKGGEVQLKSLEAQLKDKEEKLKLAQKRSKWIGAAAMMFTAAAALAAAEFLYPPLGCVPGAALALGTIKSTAIVAAFTFLSGGGLTGALLGAVAGYVVAQGALVGIFNSFAGRIAGMAVSAGLAMMAKGEVDGEVSKLNSDIAKLKEVIAQFHRETDGKGPNTEDTTAGASSGVTSGSSSGASSGSLAGVTSGSSGGTTSGATSGTAVTSLPTGTRVSGTTTCLNSKQEFSTICSDPLKFPSINISSLSTNPELQRVVNVGVGLANDAASGNVGKADVAVGNLNASAAKINDIYKQQLAKTNARLASEGKPAVGTQKEMQDTLNSMQAAFDKEMASKSQSVAGLGLSKLSLDATDVKSGQNITEASSGEVIAVPTSKGDDKTAANTAPTITDGTLASTPAAAESSKDALGNSLDNFESTENDISKNKEGSLWKQVSNRYFSNYQRFFERKKLPTP